jgi:hypothetical protein
LTGLDHKDLHADAMPRLADFPSASSVHRGTGGRSYRPKVGAKSTLQFDQKGREALNICTRPASTPSCLEGHKLRSDYDPDSPRGCRPLRRERPESRRFFNRGCWFRLLGSIHHATGPKGPYAAAHFLLKALTVAGQLADPLVLCASRVNWPVQHQGPESGAFRLFSNALLL